MRKSETIMIGSDACCAPGQGAAPITEYAISLPGANILPNHFSWSIPARRAEFDDPALQKTK
jgi:hypothetical protein